MTLNGVEWRKGKCMHLGFWKLVWMTIYYVRFGKMISIVERIQWDSSRYILSICQHYSTQLAIRRGHFQQYFKESSIIRYIASIFRSSNVELENLLLCEKMHIRGFLIKMIVPPEEYKKKAKWLFLLKISSN